MCTTVVSCDLSSTTIATASAVNGMQISLDDCDCSIIKRQFFQKIFTIHNI